MFELNNFDSIRIKLASPDKIREWSGEVKNQRRWYRTLKPERWLVLRKDIWSSKGLGVSLWQIQKDSL